MIQRATKKAQVVLPAEKYELLAAYAWEQGRGVSSVVREHLENTLIPELERRRRRAALEWLCSQELPTGDWDEIERQLERRWEECEPAG